MVWLPLLVDSRDRDFVKYPSAASYVVRLPETFYTVRGMRLASAEMPASYYAFDDVRDRTLKLSVGNPNETTTKTVVVPRGSYSAMSMAVELGAALSAAFGAPWLVAFSGTRCAFVIRPVVPTTDTVVVHPSVFADRLGFSGTREVSGAGGILEGVGASVLDPRTYVMAELREARGSGMMHTARSKKGFAKIPVKGNAFTFTFVGDDDGDHGDRPTVTFDPPIPRMYDLHLEFKFQDGTPVDFQGIEHALTLEVDASRKIIGGRE